MKVYLIYNDFSNWGEYEDSYRDGRLLCIKSTLDLAKQFIKNYKLEAAHHQIILEDTLSSDGMTREYVLMDSGYLTAVNGLAEFLEAYNALPSSDAKIDFQNEKFGCNDWYGTLCIEEREVEES